MITRRSTPTVRVGSLSLGSSHPIAIQSMTNTDTENIDATLLQARRLEEAGCDIIRLAVPNIAAADTLRQLKARGIKAPLVADIHFDYRIALAALSAGVDKIRLNPGNIADKDGIRAVVREAKSRAVPIRIGVNAGSLEPQLLSRYGAPTPEALVESALSHIAILEALDFSDILVSIKASSVKNTILANRLLASRIPYPIHLGMTEAGGGESALIKSSVGIGALLAEGIGDTVRVSLTDDPIEEIAAARSILSSLDLADGGMDIISCPTCGRTRIDLISLYREFRARARAEGLERKNIRVALMGCAVNGPGEAREADIGIAGGDGVGLLFKKGEIIRKLPESALIDALIDEIKKM